MSFFDRLPATGAIAAHRGFRACYPENTACAFAGALGKCDLIELDVQLSRDGHLVVLHDADLKRTSDVQTVRPGEDSLVCNWTLDQLRCLDVGSWFLRQDPFATLARGVADREALRRLMPQRIMTLSELLDWAARHDMPLNIEIKDQRPVADDGVVVQTLLADLGLVQDLRRVLISSFRHEYLALLHAQTPELALAALVDEQHPADLPRYLAGLGTIGYHCADRIAERSLFTHLQAMGFQVGVYTVNDPQRRTELAGWGVRLLFTDYL